MKKQFIRLTCIALTSATLLTACNSGGEKVKLALKLPPGKSYLYAMNMDQKIGAGGQNIDQTIKTDYQIDVSKVDANGIQNLDYTITRYAMNGPTGNVDTDKPDTTNMMSRMFTSMKGAKFTAQVNAKGEVQSVNGYSDMVDRMMQSVSNMMPPAQMEQMKATMKNTMSDESFKASMEQSFNIFPDKEVGVGDSWEKTVKNAMNMPMNVQTKYTVDKIEAKTVTLKLDSKITPGEGESKNPMMAGLKMKGTQKGTMVVDRATGFPTNMEMDQDMQGEMAQVPGGMTIKGKVTIKATDK